MSSTTTKTALPDLGTNSFDSGAVLYQGGLYPGGTNTVPSTFNTNALAAAASVIPLDASGNSAPTTGIIGVTSIGFSNVRDKWTGVNGGNGFKQLSDADGTRNARVVIYNCAQDTITSDAWADPNNACWTTARSNVTSAGGSLAQVQVVWLEMAKGVSGQSPSFESHLATLKTKFDLIIANIVRAENFPNCKLVFVGGRTYGGYAAANTLNPEPYAYCTWFGMQYLVAGQVAAPTRVPFVAWAPFIWANGLVPNGSECGITSGLTWDTTEFQSDHTHPTGAMETKVGHLLLTFFQTSPYTTWYNAAVPVVGTDALLLEDGTSYLLLEQGNHLLLEQQGGGGGGGSSTGASSLRRIIRASAWAIAMTLTVLYHAPRIH